MKPNLNEEKKLWKMGYKNVVGLDEAGRGPLAGPVTAGAVLVRQIPNSKFPARNATHSVAGGQIPEVNDSKKLSAKKREELFKIITKNKNIKWGIGIVSEKIIDKINIKNAAELAMVKAIKNLNSKFKIPNFQNDFLIIDGNNVKNLKLRTYNLKLIVGGDAKVFSCAAASILAKVTRDRIMLRYHKKYPKYRFDIHKGYPTKQHLKLIKKHGISKIHRKTFGPCRCLK